MFSLKDTSRDTHHPSEGGDSTKPKFDQLSNTHTEASSKKTREEALNALNKPNQSPHKLNKEPERHIGLRIGELLKAGLSPEQIIDICVSNTHILKLEKHKYWTAVSILVGKYIKHKLPSKNLYDILVANPNKEELNKRIKGILLLPVKKSKSR